MIKNKYHIFLSDSFSCNFVYVGLNMVLKQKLVLRTKNVQRSLRTTKTSVQQAHKIKSASSNTHTTVNK